jgi:deoxyribonuclease IV
MRFGAQVRQTGGFLAALRRGEEMGAEVLQLFAQSSRQWRLPPREGQAFAAYREAVAVSQVVSATVCHAPYLINLISPDPLTAERSYVSLVENLRAATDLGAMGLVLHPGSHRGIGATSATQRIASRIIEALDKAAVVPGAVCDVLLENTAGAGGTVGRSFEELADIILEADHDERIGVCIDTQHLWASGVRYATLAEADAVVGCLAATVGIARVRCLHLNDSKVPFGSNRDRHENLGKGTIGPRPLRALLGHPDLQGLPVILEVPGESGSGPGPADLGTARAMHAAGMACRRRRIARRRRS